MHASGLGGLVMKPAQAADVWDVDKKELERDYPAMMKPARAADVWD
jgi:hypothetical protein